MEDRNPGLKVTWLEPLQLYLLSRCLPELNLYILIDYFGSKKPFSQTLKKRLFILWNKTKHTYYYYIIKLEHHMYIIHGSDSEKLSREMFYKVLKYKDILYAFKLLCVGA